jgi:hypothetical protein
MFQIISAFIALALLGALAAYCSWDIRKTAA